MNDVKAQLHRGAFKALNGRVNIYDRVPDPARTKPPYVTFGSIDIIDDGIHDGSIDRDDIEAFLTMRVHSKAVGMQEAETIEATVIAALSQPFPLESYQIESARLDTANSFPDEETLITTSVVSFRYLISKPDTD